MIHRSLIAGSLADWTKALRTIDSGPRRLPQREMNWLLDQIAIAQDAERDARALLLERLTRSPLRT